MHSNIYCNLNRDTISIISHYLTFQEINGCLSLVCQAWHQMIESREFWNSQIRALDSRTFVQASSYDTVKQLKDHFINYVLPRLCTLKELTLTDEICVGTAGWFSAARAVHNLAFRTFCPEIIVYTKQPNSSFFSGNSVTHSLERWNIQGKKSIETLPMNYKELSNPNLDLLITRSKTQEILVSHFEGTVRSFYLPSSTQTTTTFEDYTPKTDEWNCDPLLKENTVFMQYAASTIGMVNKVSSIKPGVLAISCGPLFTANPLVLLHNLSTKVTMATPISHFHAASNDCLISTEPDPELRHQYRALLSKHSDDVIMNEITKAISLLQGSIQVRLIAKEGEIKNISLKGHPGKTIQKVIIKDLKDLQIAVSIAKDDNAIKLWPLQGANKIENPLKELDHANVRDIAFCQNFLISVSYQSPGLIKVWDVYTGECLKKIETKQAITAFCAHPSKMRVAHGIGGNVYIHYLNGKKS